MQNNHGKKYFVKKAPCAVVTWEPRSALRPFITFRLQFQKQIRLDTFYQNMKTSTTVFFKSLLIKAQLAV